MSDQTLTKEDMIALIKLMQEAPPMDSLPILSRGDRQAIALIESLMVESAQTTPDQQAGPRVRCKKCGDIIRSEHRHDSVRCKCKSIGVDGGSSYIHLTWTEGMPKDLIEILDRPDHPLIKHGKGFWD